MLDPKVRRERALERLGKGTAYESRALNHPCDRGIDRWLDRSVLGWQVNERHSGRHSDLSFRAGLPA